MYGFPPLKEVTRGYKQTIYLCLFHDFHKAFDQKAFLSSWSPQDQLVHNFEKCSLCDSVTFISKHWWRKEDSPRDVRS